MLKEGVILRCSNLRELLLNIIQEDNLIDNTFGTHTPSNEIEKGTRQAACSLKMQVNTASHTFGH